MKDTIIELLKEVSGEKNIHLESPENEAFGDYSANIALTMFASEKRKAKSEKFNNSRKLAEELVAKLSSSQEAEKLFEKIEVAGSGFINFWLKEEVLTKNLQEIDEAYGKSDKNKGKRVMFEYGQPNTHKLPHIGHLFSYIYGEAMTGLMEASGWEVRRVNYQGDVGLHVAKCLWAINKKTEKLKNLKTLESRVEFLQEMYEKGSKAYEEDEVAKREIQEINNKIYRNDAEIAELWKETRGWSVEYYQNFEKRLGIAYDKYYYESDVQELGKEKVIQNTPKVFKVSQGAHIFVGSKYGLHDRVFVTSEGNPTYEAKDLYLEELKMKEWPMDLLVITTASEQNDYFRVVFKALEETNPEMKGKLKHIGFGMVNLKTGKMSSRTGEIIGAVELVDSVVDRVKAITKKNRDLESGEVDEISELVGLGAVKYSFLKNNPLQDTKFDIEESIAAEGNSGPYLQYTVARTNSVLAKAIGKRQKAIEKLVPSLYSLATEEVLLLRALIKFQEVVEAAAEAYSPNLLCNYLYNLAQKFNGFYNKHQIIGGENYELRIKLTAATGQVLKNGLNLLGIEAPERM